MAKTHLNAQQFDVSHYILSHNNNFDAERVRNPGKKII